MYGTPRALHLQITDDRLTRLAHANAAVIYAQHLGAIRPLNRFGPRTTDAFRVLQRHHEDGRILVARVSRLLDYHRARDHLEVKLNPRKDYTEIDVTGTPSALIPKRL